jgi:hypothetical protein
MAENSANEPQSVTPETVINLIDVLRNLSLVLIQGTEFKLPETLYSVSTTPSYELIPKFDMSIPKLFRVVSIGDGNKPFLVFNPIIAAQFEDIDSLLTNLVTRFDHLVEFACHVIREPSKRATSSGVEYLYDEVGIPENELIGYPDYFEKTYNALHGPCSPNTIKGGSVHFATAGVAIHPIQSDLLNAYHDLMHSEMVLRYKQFVDHWAFTRKSVAPEKAPLEPNRTTFIFIIIIIIYY